MENYLNFSNFSASAGGFSFPVFIAGMALCLSLIMAIGPQNAHVLRMGIRGQHLWLTIAVCILADMGLIALGVFGLAQLGGLSDKLMGALTGAGVLLLVGYGVQAMQRFLRPQAAVDLAPATAGTVAASGSRRQAVGMALALSWLNPHAWLDTAVLIGTASLAYGRPANAVFGLGAAAGSVLWFGLLGLALWLLGRRLDSPLLWRLLDLLVALMMWGTAAVLVMELV